MNSVYVMSYFTADEEALHLAVSHDGLRFTPVNGGRPILRSHLGAQRLRDPFIGVGPDGAYHLLGTDGWTSTAVVHAWSKDLRDWQDLQLIPVMTDVPGAHNAWAPEFFYESETGAYQLLWSTCVDEVLDTEDHDWENIGQEHRIWGCRTTDFQTFTPAEVFYDPGHSVIDATVVPDVDAYLMAIKDERGTNDPMTLHKDIYLARYHGGGRFDALHGPVTPSGAEGPCLYRHDGGWVMLFDRYLEGRYEALASADGEHWNPVPVHLPAGARHVTVLQLTEPLAWLAQNEGHDGTALPH